MDTSDSDVAHAAGAYCVPGMMNRTGVGEGRLHTPAHHVGVISAIKTRHGRRVMTGGGASWWIGCPGKRSEGRRSV